MTIFAKLLTSPHLYGQSFSFSYNSTKINDSLHQSYSPLNLFMNEILPWKDEYKTAIKSGAITHAVPNKFTDKSLWNNNRRQR